MLLGKFQYMKIMKDAKMNRFTIMKEYSAEKVKDVSEHYFASALVGSKGNIQ
jgi:hypothetical protein